VGVFKVDRRKFYVVCLRSQECEVPFRQGACGLSCLRLRNMTRPCSAAEAKSSAPIIVSGPRVQPCRLHLSSTVFTVHVDGLVDIRAVL
jgi:hypothetical protein